MLAEAISRDKLRCWCKLNLVLICSLESLIYLVIQTTVWCQGSLYDFLFNPRVVQQKHQDCILQVTLLNLHDFFSISNKEAMDLNTLYCYSDIQKYASALFYQQNQSLTYCLPYTNLINIILCCLRGKIKHFYMRDLWFILLSYMEYNCNFQIYIYI